MIPAYNPPEGYFRETLESVLRQAQGPERMQIEVVDDCSPGVDVAALVREIAGDRIKVFRSPTNRGLAGCWNACIERARGRWVHILHQDDILLDQFYRRFEGLFQKAPDVSAAYCRHILADDDGHWTVLSYLERRTPGVLEDFKERLAAWQQIQCAAAVVRRDTYVRIGGYRTDLPFVLDWEMWARIETTGTWGYVPEPGAIYRLHARSETERLKRGGKTLVDTLEGGRLTRAHFAPDIQRRSNREFLAKFTLGVMEVATAQFVAGENAAAAKTLATFKREFAQCGRSGEWWRLRLRVLLKSLRGGTRR
jgi:glycosyltransferase involved in cell wall biosynthesis